MRTASQVFVFLAVCAIRVSASFAQSDTVGTVASSLPDIDREKVIDEDIFGDGYTQAVSEFSVRLFTSVLSWNDGYNERMGRKDNKAHNAQWNQILQLTFKMDRNFLLGAGLSARKIRISKPETDFFEVLTDNDPKRTSHYLRQVFLLSRYQIKFQKSRFTWLSTLYFPLHDSAFVSFENQKTRDFVSLQWINQLSIYRQVSDNFSYHAYLNSINWLNRAESRNRWVLRSSFTPAFRQKLTPAIYFYALAELNFLTAPDFLQNFYFREAAGLLAYLKGKLSLNMMFYYYALGKNSNAVNGLTLTVINNF